MASARENQDWSISRRSLVAGAGAGVATAALATHGIGIAAGRIHAAPATLRAQGTANLPTPRTQTVVMEQGTNNVWDIFNPYIPACEAYDYGLDQYQTIYPVLYNTRYWTGWPTDENPFAIPTNWWGQYLFAVGALTPTGEA